MQKIDSLTLLLFLREKLRIHKEEKYHEPKLKNHTFELSLFLTVKKIREVETAFGCKKS